MREVRRMDNESSQCHNLDDREGPWHGSFWNIPDLGLAKQERGQQRLRGVQRGRCSNHSNVSTTPKTPMIRQWVLVGGRDSTRRHAMLSSSGAACTAYWATRRPVRWRKRRRYVRFCKELRRSRSHGWTRRFASYRGSWWRRTCRQPICHHSSWSAAKKSLRRAQNKTVLRSLVESTTHQFAIRLAKKSWECGFHIVGSLASRTLANTGKHCDLFWASQRVWCRTNSSQ